MIACIDVDGTLSAYPALAALSRTLKAGGWTVYVLTGFSQREPITSGVIAQHQRDREAQADALGVARDAVQLVYGKDSLECSRQKAEFVAAARADLFIDDADRYCTDVKKRNPGCCVLRVHEEREG